MRPLLAVPLCALLAVSACAGADSPQDSPKDASGAEFCEAVGRLEIADAAAADDLAERLTEIGSPSTFSDDARDGFVSFVLYLESASDDDAAAFDLLEAPGPLLDGDRRTSGAAFISSLVQTCFPDFFEELQESKPGEPTPTAAPS